MAKAEVKEIKCCNYTTWGWIVLIIGVLFLLQDFGLWTFLGLNWWTIAFIVIGIKYLFWKK